MVWRVVGRKIGRADGTKEAVVSRATPTPAHHPQTPGPGSRDKMTR